MGDTKPRFSMATRLELRWKSFPIGDPSGTLCGSMDISGTIDISGSGCCASFSELDIYLTGITSILTQLNSRSDVSTADTRFDILISTLTSRLAQLP